MALSPYSVIADACLPPIITGRGRSCLLEPAAMRVRPAPVTLAGCRCPMASWWSSSPLGKSAAFLTPATRQSQRTPPSAAVDGRLRCAPRWRLRSRRLGESRLVLLVERPVAGSIDDLLRGASDRQLLTTGDSKSGARFERLVIDGEPHVVKHLHVDNEWILRSTGDFVCRLLLEKKSSGAGAGRTRPDACHPDPRP